MAQGYDHKEIEQRAQEKWASTHLYETDIHNSERESYYLLTEFPYPSGDLHIGHWYAFTLPDIFARFKRMKGFNVLFPIGFDAFGLPAENAAINRGLDPKKWTYDNMDSMRRQLRSMGTSYDWSKEVVTCSPDYYRWTQWLFSKLYEQGLAERKEAAVKWCPHDQTVLANEQVINGHCERCGTEVEEKFLTQWFLKITKYAKRLLADLDHLPWREDIKEAQRAWIGKSEGAKLFFNVTAITNDDAGIIEIFTTRPDTIYGATYVVIAPEHPLVETLLPLVSNRTEVQEYQSMTSRKTERERSENKEKTGVQMKGISAVNPATQQEIPIFVADYVLASYGTGAVMAVPAHDERDFEFAQRHHLPMVQVVVPQVTDVNNPPREGKENTKRDIVLVIVRNPQDNTYLCLKWKNYPWTTFITGGIEPGETPVAAAIREIKEETGYTDVKYVRTLGGVFETQFFAAHKDVNREVRSTVLVFDLASDGREAVSEEESRKYDIQWLSAEEVQKAKLQHGEFDYVWQRLHSGMDAYTGNGVLINSGVFDGRNNEEAAWNMVEAVNGERVTNYRIRDWLVSRQRYWGCPIPIVYDPDGNAHLVPPEHLPWELPNDVDFSPTGKSPLATSKELQERVERIFGKGWTPEYDTLDTFVDSSWYFLRYVDPRDDTNFSDQKLLKQWLPVNRYSGGSEHTTMHLLYARFFHKALFDLALVPTTEPFAERFNRGIILGPDGQKMSKSKGNVLNPDEFVAKYGSDAVRMYLAFIGPFNEPGHYPWNLDGVEAMRRFLDRVVRVATTLTDDAPSSEVAKSIAKTSARVATDIERFKLNTAISGLMVLLNEFEATPHVSRIAYRQFLLMLAPFAPHLSDYLWEATAGQNDMVDESIHLESWPLEDTSDDDIVTIIVQINSKKKGELRLSPSTTEEEVIEAARTLETLQAQLDKDTVTRTIYVPGRLLNFVVKAKE